MAVMRRLVPIFVAVLAAVLVAGCSSPTDGRARAKPNHVGRPLGSHDLDSVLVTPSQVSDIVGAKLTLRVDQNRPVGGGPGGPCAALDTAGADELVGSNYDAFHVLAMADGTAGVHDHVVTEAAAVYADAASAAKQFTSGTAGLGPCNGRTVNSEASWKFAVNDLSPDSVLWNKEQTDISMLWVCHGQGRVRDNVILEAMVCRGDDTGAQNADTIVNRMSASVWELSAT
jgi:PknH-like extracellular domain